MQGSPQVENPGLRDSGGRLSNRNKETRALKGLMEKQGSKFRLQGLGC